MNASAHITWWKRPVAWIALVGVLAVIGVLLLPQDGASESASSDDAADESAQSANDALQVDAVIVQPTRIDEQVRSTGTLRADESVDLAVEASGRITTLQLREGQMVQEGELLLAVSNGDLQAEKRRLQAEKTLAEAREARQARLLEEGGVSQETYDATRNEVEVLQAQLEGVEARIEQTQIRAPFTGQLGLRYVSRGSYISPDTRIATLQRTDPMKVDFSIPEKYAGQAQPGQPVTFSVRNSDASYTGEVVAIEPRISDETRSLRVRARAENGTGSLNPGSFADVTLTLGAMEDALVVPNFALVPNLGVQRVFVYRDGTAQPQEVSIGMRTDRTIQIVEGLAPGDTVITSGIQELRPGREVALRDVSESAREPVADDFTSND
ncbi:MAG: efflux RND transporter periplasmic adaptor subunit [Longimonas sp.]|uniref:efflux RND transporter periplasmic adaptor subunit n=1 Tax=Longimonas sp. TaxID=2039626 RepID=UPI003364AC9A